MNCVESKKLIQLYLDNELSARESLEVQHHLEACPSCTSLLEYFSKQDEALRTVVKAEANDNAKLREAVRTALRNRPATSAADEPRAHPAASATVWWQRPALRRVAAVLVIGLAAAFFFLRGSTPFNEKVYADAVADHDHHCSLDMLNKFEIAGYVFSSREKIDNLTSSYSTMKHAPDITAFGYTEPRAVICALNGMKTLHIVYQNPSQKPLSIFIRLRDAKMVNDDLLELNREGHKLASLSQKGTDLVIVAAPEETQASSIARAIASHFSP
jgi:hypothetical protein